MKALETAKRSRKIIVTAESCTGGLIATVLSEAPGAVDNFSGAFITYTPDQKCAALDLDRTLIETEGAVSAPVAIAMAESALKCSHADVAVAVTGVAGPDRDEKGNPIGLVFFALALSDGPTMVVEKNFGDLGRARVRYEACGRSFATPDRNVGRWPVS